MTTSEDRSGDEQIETVVIGGGQAGLVVGYHLAERQLPFVILDANPRVGDPWRRRWDSLRLFTPARFDGLPGRPFPAPAHSFPTKDEMADYLEAYAADFRLPVRSGTRVDRLSRSGDRFLVEACGLRIEADNVVVAMSSYQVPTVPPFAGQLDASVVQLTAGGYKSPAQLRPGPVLVVGAANSGAEIALDVVRAGHPTWLVGRDVRALPIRPEGGPVKAQLVRLVLRGVFHRVLTVRTPLGRMLGRKLLSQGGLRIRVKSRDLAAAGVRRGPRVAGVEDGMPVLEDGTRLEVANVVWCTGFNAGFSWIDLPVLGDRGPRHERGIVVDEPGLYFVGLPYLYALSSSMVHGVERDAAFVVDHIAARRVGAPG